MCATCPKNASTNDAKPSQNHANPGELRPTQLRASGFQAGNKFMGGHSLAFPLRCDAEGQCEASYRPPALVQYPISERHKLPFEHSLTASGWIDLGLVPIYPVFNEAQKSNVGHARAHSHPFRRHPVALSVPNGSTQTSSQQCRSHQEAVAYAQYWFTAAPDSALYSPRTLSEGPHQKHQLSTLGSSRAFWICIYFILNLTLTIYNKIVLVHFPFPYLLTATHALFGTIGCLLLVLNAVFVRLWPRSVIHQLLDVDFPQTPSPLSASQRVRLLAFSVLYTINILVSNISLQLVTIPFHQVVRSATPLFTIIISYGLLGTRVPLMTLVSLVPVIAGVCLATFGDFYFTLWGLILTLFGTFLAALKTVYANVLQTDLQCPQSNSSYSRSPSLVENGYSTEEMAGENKKRLDSLDLLYRMSPLALVQCIFYAIFTGELSDIRSNICLWDCPSQTFFVSVGTARNVIGPREITILAFNGLLAFALNYVSFTANRKAGALSMTVAANVKQVLALTLAVVMFDIAVTPLNLLGIILTLLGGVCYALVEHKQKTPPSTTQHPSGSNVWQLHR